MPIFKHTWLCKWEGFPVNFQAPGKDKTWKKTQPYKTPWCFCRGTRTGLGVLSSQTSNLEMSPGMSGSIGSPILAPLAWWAVSSNNLQVPPPNSALTITSMPSSSWSSGELEYSLSTLPDCTAIGGLLTPWEAVQVTPPLFPLPYPAHRTATAQTGDRL